MRNLEEVYSIEFLPEEASIRMGGASHVLIRQDAYCLPYKELTSTDLPKEAKFVAADRRSPGELRRSLVDRRFDVVIDSAAFGDADVRGPLEAFRNEIGHYVLCSSGAVYPDYHYVRQYRPFREEDADLTLVGDSAYAEGKRAAERDLWRDVDERLFPFTIIRPAVIEGPGDRSGRTWFWIRRVMPGGEVLVPVRCPTPYSVTPPSTT